MRCLNSRGAAASQHTPDVRLSPDDPVWQAQPLHAADDFLAGGASSSTTAEASEEALRRATEFSEAVQSEMTDATQSGTSRDMDYEEVLNSDHALVKDDVGHQAVPEVNPCSKEPASTMQAALQRAADGRTQRNGSEPGLKAKAARLKERVLHAYHSASRLAQSAARWAVSAALLLMGAAVIALLIWKVVTGTVSFVFSLTQLHAWVRLAGVAVALLVTPQTAKANVLLRALDDWGVFANYGQAKRALSVTTWSTISVFVVLVFCAGYG